MTGRLPSLGLISFLVMSVNPEVLYLRGTLIRLFFLIISFCALRTDRGGERREGEREGKSESAVNAAGKCSTYVLVRG